MMSIARRSPSPSVRGRKVRMIGDGFAAPSSESTGRGARSSISPAPAPVAVEEGDKETVRPVRGASGLFEEWELESGVLQPGAESVGLPLPRDDRLRR